MEKGITVRPSFDIAQSLLDVDEQRTLVLLPRVKLYASILAVANLFPSGMSESFLRQDPTGYYRSLFLFAHSAVYLLFAFSYFTGSSREILEKTKIFPTNAISRLWFVVVSVARHPFSIALVASNAFFFLVLYRDTILAGVIAVGLYALLTMNVAVIAATLFLFLDRRRMSEGITFVFAALFILAGFVSSLVFHSDAIMQSMPLVSFCLNGIQSALANEYGSLALNACLLIMIPVAVVWIGKRFV